MTRRNACVAFTLTVLAACGTDSRTEIRRTQLADGIRQIVSPEARPGIAEMRKLAPFVMENTQGGLILVEQPDFDQGAFFLAATTNRGVTTFGSDAQVTISLRGPVVVASRGFGRDLMSADVGPLPDMLAEGRTGRFTRVMRYLDSEEQTTETIYDCALSADGGVMNEYCGAAQREFNNRYMRSDDGTVSVSQQWLGDGNGTLVIRVLRRP